MKRLIFYALGLLLFCNSAINAQTFPPVQSTACENCVNQNYEIITGQPAISSMKGFGGNIAKPWYDTHNNIITLPEPPTFTANPINEDWRKTFLTLGNSTTIFDKVKVLVKKFVPGITYTMHYNVMSSKLAQSNFGSSATLTVFANPANPVVIGQKTTTFAPGISTNKWVKETITFTATGTELIFNFSGASKDNIIGYVNFDISGKPFDCILAPDQVELSTSELITPYPCGTVNLYSAIKSVTPTNSIPVWKVGPQSSQLSMSGPNAQNAPLMSNFSAKYYAFYYTTDMQNCYNVDLSTASVTLKYVETQVPLLKTAVTNDCPETTVNLNSPLVSSYVNKLTADEEIRWFKNNNHQGAPENALVSISGDYYGFLYNKKNNCYSTGLSTAKVTVTIKTCCTVGTDQVALSRSTAVNACPANTVNLTNVKVNNLPASASTVWYTDASHTTAVADPTQVGGGVFYAFFKDNLGCFNTDLSTSKVTVLINACDTKVSLNLKVFLQGATTKSEGLTVMRNDLQTFFGETGLLPSTDPYGSGVVYPEINKTNLKAGNIVDWVKVEIRSMQDPSIILESKSLVLRVDGTVLDVDGFAPKFNPQFGGVRIAVKHRNHLAVVGLAIVSFNAGSVSYDFSTGLPKAYNVGAPVQMVLTSGVWCMAVGDVQQDFAVDNVDYAIFDSSFNKGEFDVYSAQDLNLDGLVDNVDYSFFDFSFNAGFFSTLINY